MARITPATKHPPVLEFASWKTQAHVRYHNSTGDIVPGATTILNNLGKPQLVGWANGLGLQGIDSNKYVDEAKQVGELAHYLIECEIKAMSPEEKIPDFSQNQIERASHAVLAWKKWCEQFRSIKTVASEIQLVSDEFNYGGTIDWLVEINGVLTLVDFKTSNGIYRDHRVQAGAYWHLLKEHGYRIGDLQIIKVPRIEGEPVKPAPMSGRSVMKAWRIFQHLLGIYYEIKGDPEFR